MKVEELPGLGGPAHARWFAVSDPAVRHPVRVVVDRTWETLPYIGCSYCDSERQTLVGYPYRRGCRHCRAVRSHLRNS